MYLLLLTGSLPTGKAIRNYSLIDTLMAIKTYGRP